MKNKPFLLFLLLTILCSKVSASKDYFVDMKHDTTFCINLSYSLNNRGYLRTISYYDIKTKTQKNISEKSKLPLITTFFVNGATIDLIPLKANKPFKYKRYTERVLDGKLKIYLDKPEYDNSVVNDMSGNASTRGSVGAYRFFIKMPDGTFYKINNQRKMKKVLKPFLINCDKFKKQYQGDFKFCIKVNVEKELTDGEKEFIEMIKLYNSSC